MICKKQPPKLSYHKIQCDKAVPRTIPVPDLGVTISVEPCFYLIRLLWSFRILYLSSKFDENGIKCCALTQCAIFSGISGLGVPPYLPIRLKNYNIQKIIVCSSDFIYMWVLNPGPPT